jgi:hypothetical protein
MSAVHCSLCLLSGFTMLTVLSECVHTGTPALQLSIGQVRMSGGGGGGWHAWLPMVLPVAWWGGGKQVGGGALHKYPAHISPAYVFLMQAHSRFHLLVTYFRRYEQ